MSRRGAQLRLGTGTAHRRTLFSEDFLADRLPAWPEFEALEVGAIRDELVALWERERATLASANEAQTEERLIQPILRALGFSYTVQ